MPENSKLMECKKCFNGVRSLEEDRKNALDRTEIERKKGELGNLKSKIKEQIDKIYTAVTEKLNQNLPEIEECKTNEESETGSGSEVTPKNLSLADLSKSITALSSKLNELNSKRKKF